ncbi:hypothetical protein A4G26_21715 [Mycobacterium kansasii]|nr:hypothetical protein A4G26_21715 [Mycobacterium kansasii]
MTGATNVDPAPDNVFAPPSILGIVRAYPGLAADCWPQIWPAWAAWVVLPAPILLVLPHAVTQLVAAMAITAVIVVLRNIEASSAHDAWRIFVLIEDRRDERSSYEI